MTRPHKYAYTATLTSPLHHGAGTAGNTSLLRTADIIDPTTGTPHRVPYISGNSIRNRLRTTLAWHTVHHTGIEPGTLNKAAVDLLFTGGAVTTTGSQIDLQTARDVETHYPALAMLGYAAQSDITAGTLEVSHANLVCRENKWRLPDPAHPLADTPAARFRGEEFGTRHDTTGTATDALRDIAAEATGTAQMIYDLQVLRPGAVLYGEYRLRHGHTPAHRLALEAGLVLQTRGGGLQLGAKNAVGYGHTTTSGLPVSLDAVTEWETHLHEHAAEIRDLIDTLTR